MEYIALSTLAQSLGVIRESIYQDIRLGNLSAEKRKSGHGDRWGGAWFIRSDYAQEYSDWVKKKQQSITASELARRTKQGDAIIREAIRKGDLVAIRRRDASRYPYYILEADARTYSERMGWAYSIDSKEPSNGHKQINAESIDVGTPDRCGSCGTEKGNILGDIDKKTHERYGYLCARCHRLVRDFHGDITRMRKVLAYIENTRLSQVY